MSWGGRLSRDLDPGTWRHGVLPACCSLPALGAWISNPLPPPYTPVPESVANVHCFFSATRPWVPSKVRPVPSPTALQVEGDWAFLVFPCLLIFVTCDSPVPPFPLGNAGVFLHGELWFFSVFLLPPWPLCGPRQWRCPQISGCGCLPFHTGHSL